MFEHNKEENSKVFSVLEVALLRLCKLSIVVDSGREELPGGELHSNFFFKKLLWGELLSHFLNFVFLL